MKVHGFNYEIKSASLVFLFIEIYQFHAFWIKKIEKAKFLRYNLRYNMST